LTAPADATRDRALPVQIGVKEFDLEACRQHPAFQIAVPLSLLRQSVQIKDRPMDSGTASLVPAKLQALIRSRERAVPGKSIVLRNIAVDAECCVSRIGQEPAAVRALLDLAPVLMQAAGSNMAPGTTRLFFLPPGRLPFSSRRFR
jgi:hypothetical protein